MFDISNFAPTGVRTLDEMRSMLQNETWARDTSNRDLYYMWRDALEAIIHKQKSEQAGIRYDITKILPILLGGEFNKTMGHFHNSPEVYEVLNGNGYFLFQDYYNNAVHKTNAIKTSAGDKIFIPPAIGHLAINIGPGDLTVANVAVRHRSHDYSLYQEKHGGAYYGLKNGEDVKWEKNPAYGPLPELKSLTPSDTFKAFGIKIPSESLYQAITENIESLYFLK